MKGLLKILKIILKLMKPLIKLGLLDVSIFEELFSQYGEDFDI